ncbi:MAG: hydrogenase maturation protease [Dehalococcoidia bacterium]|nr:hydrogenase maturation protease [Dehalococcoidia bacterium]
MTKETGQQATLILGLGNVLMGDEGFGVHVVRRLKGIDLPGNIRVVEGGVGGFGLLNHLDGVERLLIIDAMMTDSLPGELLIVKPGPNLTEPSKRVLSFHQIGALELVAMGQLLGYEPQTSFMVTRPERIEMGMELSPSVEKAVGRAARLIEEMCRGDFAMLERSENSCTL